MLIISYFFVNCISHFLFFLGQLGFKRHAYVEGYNDIFQSMYAIDKLHNLFPSLHVTYLTLSASAMMRQSNSKIFNLIMITWIILIALSVVLVHQQHVIDIVMGLILAMTTYKSVELKIVEDNGRTLVDSSAKI